MSRALHKLSARFVETASQPKRYGDGGGLYLVVTSKSSKRWVFMFRWRGKLTEMGLGSAVEGSSRYKSLAAARQEAASLRSLLAADINPLEAARAAADEQAAIPTFGEFADAYVALMIKGMRNLKHRAQWETSLGTREINIARVKKDAVVATKEHIRALTSLREKRIDKVETEDVLRVLKPIWLVKNETATRVRSRIENVLDAAKAADKRSGENPARWRGHLNKLLPKSNALARGHHAAMPYEEVPQFVVGLRKRHAMAARALESTLLYADEVRLYCAPDYVKELRLQVPSDLVRATLLHTTLQPHWKSWLQRFSTLSDAQIEAIPHLHFDQSLLAIEAARYGQGAVLSSAILTEAEMRDGALCEPFECRLPVTKGYYVVHHKGTPLRPAALALKNWLLQVAGSEPLS